MDSLLCNGSVYQTWRGKLIEKKTTPLQTVVKKMKGNIHFNLKKFLSNQGIGIK